jgi:hypothetical protein
MQEAIARRSILLLKQFEFIQTRQKAFEQVFFLDRWAWLKMIWNPIGLLNAVDNRQRSLLAEAEKQLADAQTKVKIQPISLATH